MPRLNATLRLSIRRTQTRNRTSGDLYVTYRPIQTARVNGAVKRTMLLNLDSHFDLCLCSSGLAWPGASISRCADKPRSWMCRSQTPTRSWRNALDDDVLGQRRAAGLVAQSHADVSQWSHQ